MNISFKKGHFFMTASLRVLFLFLFISNGLMAQHQPEDELLPLTPADYGKWESVRGAEFSHDGKWLSLITGTNEGDRHLTLKDLNSDQEFLFENVNGVSFSPDNQWVILRRTLPGKELQRVREVGGEFESRAWLYHLVKKDTVSLNNLKKYDFSNDGRFLAMTRTKDHGNTLLIRNMQSGKEISFGNVHGFEWNAKKNMLLFRVENHKGDNEIQIYNAESGSIETLDSHKEAYLSMGWLNDSFDAMVVKELRSEEYKEISHKVLIFKGLEKGTQKFVEFDPYKQGLIDEDMRVLSEDLSLSEDGSRLFFKLYHRTKKHNEAPREILDTLVVNANDHADTKLPVFYNKHDEAPDLQIWHSKDKVLVPAQRVSGMKGFETPRTAVYDFDTEKIVMLQDEVLEKVNISEGNRLMLGYDETPYEREGMFGRHYYDVYLVDSKTGQNKKVVEKVSKYYELSPDQEFFIYLKNDRFFIYDIAEEISQDLTGHLEVSFIDEHNDHPLPQKPAYGFVGWAKDGKSFMLNSEFDVWQFFTGGKAPRNLTNGTGSENIYRLDFTSKQDGQIDTDKRLLFSVEGKWTKRTGYAEGKPGNSVVQLIFEDANIKRIARNDHTGQMVFTRSSFDMPGDAYYTANSFKDEIRLTSINQFQDDYQWSKAELVDFTTAQGNRAQGVLYYPANYKQGEKYPMITYVYEKLSHGLHNYMQPSENDYYNTLLWVQSGYFVFKPDMEFESGNPGVSAARTLENAVGAVVEKGDVDAAKVGLIGHSWGGYQAGFVPTQTDIFAASVAGAGLTNLISMNLAVTPAFGWRPENDHFEVGQERMEVAPWVAPDKYVENSTVMQIDKLNTPVMFMVGDSDANVNWSQGVEYYNAARRAGKEFVLLVYENEGHSLSRKNNQIDYQQRILKWFDYHLKGEQPEDWMTGSVPYSEQQDRLKNWNN